MSRPHALLAGAALAGSIALAALAAPALPAQQVTPAGVRAETGALSGTVHDSTAGGALAGATVLLTHATRADVSPISLVADSAGRWAAPEVATGRWYVTFFHRAAEEYGVVPVPRQVTVTGGGQARVALAIPSARALRAAVCGAAARSDSAGVLVGSVRDEETGRWLAGASVTVAWRVIEFRDGVRVNTERVPVTTAPDGTFRFCAVPVDDPLSVRAAARDTTRDTTGAAATGTLRSGELFVTVPPGSVTRLHVGVGRTAPEAAGTAATSVLPRLTGPAVLAGTVTDPGGRPRADARVLVMGTGREATTGEAGTFRFDSLPAGSWTVEARAIGATPVRQTVLLRGDAVTTTRLDFQKWTPTLDRVVVYGSLPIEQKFMDDFLARRERGVGRFFTSEEIVKSGANQLSELLYRIPDVRVRPAPQAGRSAVLEGRGGCKATVFMNGMRVPEGEREIDYLARPREVLALEVHDDINGVPAQFAGASHCVIVGIWTRR